MNSVTIRKAKREDSLAIATHLLLAMEDIVCEFIGQKDPNKAKDFLIHFIAQEHNQYSYQNCFVAEDDHEVIAAVNIYDGSQLIQLRVPISQYIKIHFKTDFNPEDETQPGEYYIDSLGVNPNQQGKGIGATVLKFLINYYVNQNGKTIGLLVDEENPKAKKLYLKLGFKSVGQKILVGKRMEHLQIKPKAESY
ncbi:GNAT family N-acetyltransferase [Gelidibacter sp. F63206]|uniref:GNAT family N-acetyltransferase n=1 Tax=Gelidibacter sp. F63206 TaxID=2926425 RepID=UPI001FF4B3FA|nr:GNAT family N-acetyltransferase [Gelidibacter sp. F63206]MCK0114427.1 GNAT family N-acetyltransferase [Gelidibacter sp. F63206]